MRKNGMYTFEFMHIFFNITLNRVVLHANYRLLGHMMVTMKKKLMLELLIPMANIGE